VGLSLSRQWKSQQPLSCLQLRDENCTDIETRAFLQEGKYDPRYDIFWRFVAGLLDADREEPRNLLGPTHQRLVMHCLSEVERKGPPFTELRSNLENQLKQWLLFECDFTKEFRSVPLAMQRSCTTRYMFSQQSASPT
jgi:hypothetical protein